MSSQRATLFGFAAILMWSLLALLTVASGTVPPFQLAAMTFAIGGAIGAVWVSRSGAWGALRQSPQAWAFGIGGLGAAVLGLLADATSVTSVYRLCAWLPALGLVTAWLPDIEPRRHR